VKEVKTGVSNIDKKTMHQDNLTPEQMQKEVYVYSKLPVNTNQDFVYLQENYEAELIRILRVQAGGGEQKIEDWAKKTLQVLFSKEYLLYYYYPSKV